MYLKVHRDDHDNLQCDMNSYFNYCTYWDCTCQQILGWHKDPEEPKAKVYMLCSCTLNGMNTITFIDNTHPHKYLICMLRSIEIPLCKMSFIKYLAYWCPMCYTNCAAGFQNCVDVRRAKKKNEASSKVSSTCLSPSIDSALLPPSPC